MSATIDLRAMRVLRRARSISVAPWRAVPPLAWVLLANAWGFLVPALVLMAGVGPNTTTHDRRGNAIITLCAIAFLFAAGSVLTSIRHPQSAIRNST